MVIDIVKLLIRYDGIGLPLTNDERELLLFALYNESEQRGGLVADARFQEEVIYKQQRIIPYVKPDRNNGT